MENMSIIIDNGSSTIRAGFTGDEAPQVTFPATTGRPRLSAKGLDKELYVGDDAQSKLDLLAVRHPIHCGKIIDWEGMEALWRHTFDLLHAAPEEHAVCLTAAPLTSRFAQEKMAQIMFEALQVPAMYVGNQGVFSLYAAGRTTGLAVGSGDGVTFCVPVKDGHVITEGCRRYGIAGRDLTQNLMSLLTEQGYNFLSTAEEEIARDIKEKHCYVAADFNEEMSTSNLALSSVEADYTLPDGQVIKVRQERFACSEAFFQPYLFGTETTGIHNVIYDAVMKCDTDMHDKLIADIVLSGGTTTLPGFANRLQRELTALRDGPTPTVVTSASSAPEYAWVQKDEKRTGGRPKKLRVVSPPDAKDCVWRGAALVTSMPTFGAIWLTKAEYEESGPSVVRQKFM